MMTMENITPRDGIKAAVSGDNLSPKERQKLLALSLVWLVQSEEGPWSDSKGAAVAMMWKHSQMINPLIPDFDEDFIMAINDDPKGFENYR